jgi:hypothetical protein
MYCNILLKLICRYIIRKRGARAGVNLKMDIASNVIGTYVGTYIHSACTVEYLIYLSELYFAGLLIGSRQSSQIILDW